MKDFLLFILVFFVLALAWGQQQFAYIGDFSLENGKTIDHCKIGYQVFGKLNEERSNAIVWPTWYGGSSTAISGLVGPGKFVDTNRYCLIAIDALGNGISSSPSHLKNPNEFPIFSIADMVRAGHCLITQYLKIEKLHGIIGGSMGGMQSLEWLVRYPEMIDRAIVYVGTPRPTSYDLLLTNTLISTIQTMHKYNCTEEEILYHTRMIMALCMDSANYRIKQTTRETFPKFLSLLAQNSSQMTSYDFLRQLQAMEQHDISKNYNNDMLQAAKRIQAKIFLVISAHDRIVNPQPALELSKILQCPILILDNELGHLGVGYEFARLAPIFREFWETGMYRE